MREQRRCCRCDIGAGQLLVTERSSASTYAAPEPRIEPQAQQLVCREGFRASRRHGGVAIALPVESFRNRLLVGKDAPEQREKGGVCAVR